MAASSKNRAQAGAAGRVLVIAGAGDVGGRLALRRADMGNDVIALRRRELAMAPGIRTLRADLASGEGLARLPRRVDALVFCAAPDQRDEAAYRALYLDGLRRLMDACEAPRLIFVSSTAVYGQDAGEWVDEASPAEPPAFNGRVLRQAEEALAPHGGGIALRLSGLYGPGREMMLRKARAGEPGRPHWTNRLHVDDAAAALSHLLDADAPHACYVGSDDLPALESEVLDWLRSKQGLPAVPAATGAVTGRRLRNARLRASGWAPAHPDYRAGYGALLAGPGV
ncbi:NAD-dependent epimerase/dehydratase family protein [Arenimonas terrae]|uniref:NAD-dependent epimerase/dehydratase family protein n=1 Tax=Arenimonas terrae TaxID=2546226 RepID=A0A5C4RWF2_9GAMM|nr:NAD-dependent epimerase/dehydratase family protein [Arenimonas terrae]TNJ35358.1 NAD-dependent epimerase/dehydratase family protein [Arenimonas terrae]